jgi:hypothetical protein
MKSLLAAFLLSSLAVAQTGSIAGLWYGAIDVGGMKLRLVLHISPAGNGFSGTMDSVDQGANGIPMDSITQTGDSIHFEIKRLFVTYDGTLNAAKTQIAGKFTQGGTLPLNFDRTDKIPELNRPQDPKKPYPYNEEEVAYENKKGGVKLAGTLTWPRDAGPFPAVLLITGSGPQDRNEALLGHRPFLVLSDHLTRHGIAVLRVDDRGVGGSTGNNQASTGEDFASDVLTGIEFLKTRKEVNPAQIGLIGHSEGALIAPVVAAASPVVAYIVLMAAPAMRGDEIMFAQGEAIGKAMGGTAEGIAMNRALQSKMFAIIREEPDSTAAQKKIREAWSKTVADMPEAQQKLMNSAGMLDAQLGMALSPWFRYFMNFDPVPVLKKVKCPVLALGGEHDLQVPSENLAKLAEALETGGNRDYEIVKLAGLNHLFQTSKTGAPTEYGQIQETIAPAALDVMTSWLLRHTGKR